ncbi:hypothetical protein Pfo_019613 [Paulownia fortunei]|nr:hypothetical protein Pfo_019613 [Paulownia fortunei]
MGSLTAVKPLKHNLLFPPFTIVNPLLINFKICTSIRSVNFFQRRRCLCACQQNRCFSSRRHLQIIVEIERDAMAKKNGVDLTQFPPERIRNFSIIAHIDHGKSTLADRLLELTGTIQRGLNQPQFLDKLQVERQRGITVKAQTTSMIYRQSNQSHQKIDKQDPPAFLLNLIDTPGHVDFSYEVSRSLAACQGVLLVVDASQGIQAQTVANFYLASECNLAVIPVINKIDLPTADPDHVKEQLAATFDLDPSEALLTSAKTGEGLEQVLEAIIERIPPPRGKTDSPLRMLLFDSYFHEYKKVICFVAVVDGVLRKGERIMSAATGKVGYVICGMYSTEEARVGDTLYKRQSTIEPLPGFKPAKHMVFSGLYPADGTSMSELEHAIEKLTCNDSSVSVEIESSLALGRGFRCGFLGLLHMDVFHQRLEQEYGVHVHNIIPTVPYIFEFEDGRYVGPVITLCFEREGEQLQFSFITSKQALLKYRLPLREIVVDFYDRLKTITSGYAIFMYEEAEYQLSGLIKLDAFLNNQKVDVMATIVHKSRAQSVGDSMLEMLKKFINRVPAALLERKGVKKQLKQHRSVNIPREAFLELMKLS